jgi:hypothetical protein
MLKNPEARRVNIDIEFKGMTIEVYATPKARPKQLLMTDCRLNGFHIIAIGEDDDLEHYLCFTIYANDSIELHQECKPLFHKDTFLTFEQTQHDLPLGEPSPKIKEFASGKQKGNGSGISALF